MKPMRLRRRAHELHFDRRLQLLDGGGLWLHHEAGEKRDVERERDQDRRDPDARCRLRYVQRVGAP